jgi:hypothetical protein
MGFIIEAIRIVHKDPYVGPRFTGTVFDISFISKIDGRLRLDKIEQASYQRCRQVLK